MNLETKKWIVAILSLFFLASLLIVAWVEGGRKRVVGRTRRGGHRREPGLRRPATRSRSPGIVGQWQQSSHSRSRHRLPPVPPAPRRTIWTPTSTRAGSSPPSCRRRTAPSVTRRSTRSSRAATTPTAGRSWAAWTMCWPRWWKVTLELDEAGEKVTPRRRRCRAACNATAPRSRCWRTASSIRPPGPTPGMGRLNPDGSSGSCSACHLRHNFSRAQARQPENCGRCHLGPDHPQMEVYNESKHGIAFAANRIRFDDAMDEKDWIPGRAVRAGTHLLLLPHGRDQDPGGDPRRGRSDLVDAAAAGLREDRRRRARAGTPDVKSWEDRRADMQEVCTSCHGPEWVDNWYHAVRQPGGPLQRQVRPPVHRALQDGPVPGLVQQRRQLRRRDRVHLLPPLAPRGPPSPPRRRHDGSRLHPVARYVRGGRALLPRIRARACVRSSSTDKAAGRRKGHGGARTSRRGWTRSWTARCTDWVPRRR